MDNNYTNFKSNDGSDVRIDYKTEHFDTMRFESYNGFALLAMCLLTVFSGFVGDAMADADLHWGWFVLKFVLFVVGYYFIYEWGVRTVKNAVKAARANSRKWSDFKIIISRSTEDSDGPKL